MIYFQNISPLTWEHPDDKAALNALRQLKGFDQILKYVMSITDEKKDKLKLLSTAVKATEKSYSKLYEMMKHIVKVFNWQFTPDLFVVHDPELNAYTSGANEPYIVVNKGLLEATDEEILFVIGHEMGHIMSEHVLYSTMLRTILNLTKVTEKDTAKNLLGGVLSLGGLGGLGLDLGGLAVSTAIQPIQYGLAVWARKGELTADRAGVLAVQNPDVSQRFWLKLAETYDLENIDIDDLYKQALEYDDRNDVLDVIYKIYTEVENGKIYASHPDNIIRFKELKTWEATGKYQAILDGNYLRLNGKQNTLQITQKNKFCVNCGKPAAQGNFCPHCGNKY